MKRAPSEVMDLLPSDIAAVEAYYAPLIEKLNSES